MKRLLAFVARLADPLYMVTGDKAYDGAWRISRDPSRV